jgi:type II secretory pathway component GspD/PulD (secretin)
MKSDYEEKRQARIEGLKRAGSRARTAGRQRVERAHEMAQAIPFGQPILVGHHSETRDRNYRGKIENGFRAGFAEIERADQLEARAAAAEANTAIFSDDPNAVEKLEDKLARLEKRQEVMTAANKLVRKGDREGLAEMGFSEDRINRLFAPVMGRPGFQTFELTNNGANIRRIRERVEYLKRHAQDQNQESEVNGVKIVDNADENRVQIFFPGKPDESTRAALKSHGFHWTPSLGCWQRQRSFDALYQAKQIAAM